jgi:hypothetical protein
MRKHRVRLAILAASGLMALIAIGASGGQADDSKRLTADDVIKLWQPKQDGVEDFQQFVASPRESTALAASTFRIVGPSFEGLWNHYADLCGIKERYEAKRFLVSGGASDRGSYVVSDRAASNATVERGLSVFLLRTERYTVTATIQPNPDGKGMLGSIAAVIP